MANNESVLRGFGALLQNLEEGQLINDAGDALSDLNRKLARISEAQGKAKGTLTIILNLEAEKGVVEVTGKISVKDPVLARDRTVLFLTKDGLQVDNPKQAKLALREVPKPNDPARDIGGETGAARSV